MPAFTPQGYHGFGVGALQTVRDRLTGKLRLGVATCRLDVQKGVSHEFCLRRMGEKSLPAAC